MEVDDVDDVTPGQCPRPVPTRDMRGDNKACEARGKAQGSLLRPGATGKGKDGMGRLNGNPR
ncbi:hypothetical protein GCM10009558_033790 [Virgisporangium aurantiacum]